MYLVVHNHQLHKQVNSCQLTNCLIKCLKTVLGSRGIGSQIKSYLKIIPIHENIGVVQLASLLKATHDTKING